MTVPARNQPSTQDLAAIHGSLRRAWREKGPLPLPRRKAILSDLLDTVRRRKEDVAEAIDADFGHRSRHETLMAEIFPVVQAIRHTRRHLDRWVRPRRVAVDPVFWPSRARVERVPLGVVGIISPWNYPFQLAVAPLVAALAAGNRAMVKPSEYTPETSRLLAEILGAVLEPDEVRVVQGGPEVAAAFSALPFDHLLFTGSTAVGRKVMEAAARNLTPVTLELGGKSPAILVPGTSIERAAAAIVRGKLLNAGQTCIAPDFVTCHRDQVEPLCEAIVDRVSQTWPRLGDNPDYSSIVNERHVRRLVEMLEDAERRGARIVRIDPAGEDLPPSSGKLHPTLVLDAPEDARIMQEEIFGPWLPIVAYDRLEEALDRIADGPHPLALYVFDDRGDQVRRVLDATLSGGVTVNGTVLHFAQENLPFGGVGESGMGAYHGEAGFRTFSHERAVFLQSRWQATHLTDPPYGRTIERLLRFLIGG